MATKKKLAKKKVVKKTVLKKAVAKKAVVKKAVVKKAVVKKAVAPKTKVTAKKKTPTTKKSTKKVINKKTLVTKAPNKKKPEVVPAKKEAVKKVRKTPSSPAKTASQKKPVVAKKHSPRPTKLMPSKPKSIDPSILKIRERLIANRVELLSLIQASQSVEREVGDLTFSNEIDLASSLEGREMLFQLTSRDRNELKLIEDALFRIKNGGYGECESCEKKISMKRLQIMPLTALCIECQEVAENL